MRLQIATFIIHSFVVMIDELFYSLGCNYTLDLSKSSIENIIIYSIIEMLNNNPLLEYLLDFE